MKKISLISALLPMLAAAQNYSIDWHKVSGGGGTSSGGTFTLAGTVGQADATPQILTGGSYSLTPGYWSMIAVMQTPGAPLLSISRSGNKIIVSWPSSATGFRLQQNPNSATANWSTSTGVVDNGTTKSLTLTSPSGNLFFRLINP